MYSYQRLQQWAIAISIASILYNGAEGGLSIGFGSESSSRSLIFFGIQSGVEVASSCIVVWRFRHIAKPGEEAKAIISNADLRIEKYGTWSIGILLAILALGTEITSIVDLALHIEPDSSNASLIISASALVIMILIWLPKRYLARALNSSTMMGEATCSLSCIQITTVLFIGSLIFRLWKGGWWVDSATSLILGLLFGREAWKMISWVRDPEFNGGCCADCKQPRLTTDAELGQQYHDLCDCCLEKDECKSSGVCVCEKDAEESLSCCKPLDHEGKKCCTHKVVQGARPLSQEADDCKDSCCAKPQREEPVAVVNNDPPCTRGCCTTTSIAPPSKIAQDQDSSCQDACCTKEVKPKPHTSTITETLDSKCDKGCCIDTAKDSSAKAKREPSCKDSCCADEVDKTDADSCCEDTSAVNGPGNNSCSCCKA